MVVGPGGIEALSAKSNATRAARRTQPVGARPQAMAAPAATWKPSPPRAPPSKVMNEGASAPEMPRSPDPPWGMVTLTPAGMSARGIIARRCPRHAGRRVLPIAIGHIVGHPPKGRASPERQTTATSWAPRRRQACANLLDALPTFTAGLAIPPAKSSRAW
eukprot:5836080-Lingulodinium_polyedra.AAC.1